MHLNKGENKKEIHSAQTEGVPLSKNVAAGQAQQSTCVGKEEQKALTSQILGAAHAQSPSVDNDPKGERKKEGKRRKRKERQKKKKEKQEQEKERKRKKKEEEEQEKERKKKKEEEEEEQEEDERRSAALADPDPELTGLCKTKEEAMGGPILEGSTTASNVVTEPHPVDSTSEGSGEVEQKPIVDNEFWKDNKASECSTAVSCTSNAVEEEHDTTAGKSRNKQENLTLADQEQQLETDDVGTKEVNGKNATRNTVTMDHTPSTKEPQQSAQGEHNISGSVSNKKENQTAQVSEYL